VGDSSAERRIHTESGERIGASHQVTCDLGYRFFGLQLLVQT